MKDLGLLANGNKRALVSNGKKRVLKIRYKNKFGTRTRLVLGTSKSARAPKSGGRILRLGKVSNEQILKVGEFNDIPERLMREFGIKVPGKPQ